MCLRFGIVGKLLINRSRKEYVAVRLVDHASLGDISRAGQRCLEYLLKMFRRSENQCSHWLELHPGDISRVQHVRVKLHQTNKKGPQPMQCKASKLE